MIIMNMRILFHFFNIKAIGKNMPVGRRSMWKFVEWHPGVLHTTTTHTGSVLCVCSGGFVWRERPRNSTTSMLCSGHFSILFYDVLFRGYNWLHIWGGYICVVKKKNPWIWALYATFIHFEQHHIMNTRIKVAIIIIVHNIKLCTT